MPNEHVKYGIFADSLGYEMGLRDGDKILAVGGKPFEKFNDKTVLREIVINDAKTIEVDRNGQKKTLPIDEKFIDILTRHENKNQILFWPRYPFIVLDFVKDAPVAKSGIQKDDKIIAFNDQPTPYFNDFFKLAMANKGQTVRITVDRNGAEKVFQSSVNDQGKVGIYPYSPGQVLGMATQKYSIAEAFPAGFVKGWVFLEDQVKAFGQMFRGKIKASESLGGFGTIGSMFGNVWDWERFWTMTAILSLILAFMNLLPIPALDGGHVMFLLYEVVTGRKPSDKFLETATLIGFVIIISLVLYANGLDIFRTWFPGK